MVPRPEVEGHDGPLTAIGLLFTDPALRTPMPFGWLAAFYNVPRGVSARLQGFPDTWEFCGGKTAAYRQVGNAFRLRWPGPGHGDRRSAVRPSCTPPSAYQQVSRPS